MKHYALLLVLFSFAGLKGISAEGSAGNAGLFSVSVETFGGFLYGSMVEEVYKGDTLMSRLTWDEHGAPYTGVGGTFGVGRFFLNTQLLSAIPIESGIVTDTDWTGPGGRQDQYSEHRSFFDKHFELSGLAGYAHPLGDFELAFAAGILYRNRKWSAQDGFLQYEGIGEVWSEETAKTNVKGIVMTYESEMWFPVVELEASYSINDRFAFSITGDWYPYLHITTIDSHYLKQERYIDAMRGGMGGQVFASMAYTPKRLKGLSFAAEVGWEGVFPPKGSTSTGDIGQSAALFLEEGYYSKIESSLWWMSLSIILCPLDLR
jgi:hypothetical protein